MLTGNKGEWSELYVFLKLLSDGNLYAAKENLERIPDIFYPIISILRDSSSGALIYKRDSTIKISLNSEFLLELPIESFHEKATLLLNTIKKEEGTFSNKELEEFLSKIRITSIKSDSSKKEDISLIVHDINTGLNPTLYFSIKSQLGSSSTLLNASKSTNFTYILSEENSNFVKESSPEIYAEEELKIKELLKTKISQGYNFTFDSIDSPVFESNLRMVDSLLPEILGELLLSYYLGEGNTIVALVKKLIEKDPLNSGQNASRFYEHKIKNLLLDIALGMTPATPWNGHYDATGGYIIVKEDGNIVCYHVYNLNEFKNYLFSNTKLDTPSTTRHSFGKVYLEEFISKIKLNLQIRFIK